MNRISRILLAGTLLTSALWAATSIATTTTLTTSGNSVLGHSVTLTASVVQQGSSTPVTSGSVSFESGTGFIGVAALNGSGQAVLNTSLLPSGLANLRAIYQGSGAFTKSVSSSASSLTVASASGSVLGPANLFPTGNQPDAVAVGDFNNDGIQDLAVINEQDQTVSVLIGNGTGGFTPEANSPFQVGVQPTAIAVADFNNDGKLDIAVANSGGNIGILLNNGAGGFSGETTVTVTSPQALAVGDFNNDGFADIAVATTTVPGKIVLLMGNGTGSFTTGASLTVDNEPNAVAVGDFNNDGNPDIVSLSGGSRADVMLGTGGGSFASAVGYSLGSVSFAESLAVADFTGDGNLDIATGNFSSANVSVLVGSAAGTFTLMSGSPFTVGAHPTGIVAGDFNGDGKIDIATSNETGNSISVLIGNNTTFAAQAVSTVPPATTPNSLAVGDFNGDGIADLAETNASASGPVTLSGNVGVLFGAAPSALLNTATYISGSVFGFQLGAEQLTATVFPGATAGDLVTFYVNGVILGTAPIVVTSNVATATLAATGIPAGTVTLTARYNGGTTYAQSTDPSTVPLISTGTKGPAAVSLTASPTTVNTNAPVTLTATVSPLATGQVNFFYYTNGNVSNLLGNATLSGGNPNTATLTVSNALPAGQVPIAAAYQGDSNYTFANSPTIMETVIQGTVTTLTSSANPANPGAQFTLTANVTGNNAAFATSALVTFLDGVTVIGTSPVTGGVATLQTSSTVVGTHSITAAYAGDSTHTASTSSVLAQTIIGTTTLTLATTPSITYPGQALTMTATVSPVVTGVVGFYDRGILLAGIPLNGSGVATFTTSLLAAIPHSLTARYAGITGILGSVSNTINPQIRTPHQTGIGTPVTWPASPATVANTNGVVFGDFNNDGIADIAATTSTATPTQGVQIFLGNNDGTFQAPIFYATTGVPSGPIRVSDFNADGAQDLALLTASGVEVLLNSGTGTGAFGSSHLTAGSFTSLSVADFNSDGLGDLFVGSTGAAATYLGNGDGTFGAASVVGATVLSGNVLTAVADLNNDGIADLVMIDANAEVNLAINKGNGTFMTPSLNHLTGVPLALVTADFDGDGNMDLAYSDTNSAIGEFHVGYGDGSGRLKSGGVQTVTTGTAAGYLATSDFNGDGVPDIAVADPSGNVKIFNSNGIVGGFGAGATIAVASAPASIAAGVIGGSGSLVTGFGVAGNIAVLQGVLAKPTVSCTTTSEAVQVNAGIFFQCPASGGISPYTFSLGTGLPAASPAITIDSNGNINGTPTTAGTYTFTVKATDAEGQSGVSSTLTLYVLVPLVATNGSVATGNVNQAYTTVVAVSGGTAPYSCTTTSNNLPTGMTFDPTCTLSGTPTESGFYSVSFHAVDSSPINPQQANGFISFQVIGLPITVSISQTAGTNPTPYITTGTFTVTTVPNTISGSGTIAFTPTTGSPSLKNFTVTNGTGSVANANSLAAGTYSVTATVTATSPAAYGSGTSSPFTFTVTPTTPTVTVTSSVPVPPVPGTSITLTAKTSLADTGTMTFFDNGTQLGSPATMASNAATYTTTALTLGSHAITATYSGDANHTTATSATVFEQGIFTNLFTDTFTPSASTQWLNEVGTWSATGGVYDAASPSSSPNAHSLLPNTLTDFAVHVTTSTTTGDGGVWLRATDVPGTGIGVDGILYVIQPSTGHAFFSVVQNGVAVNGTTATLTAAAHTFDIVVIGNVYSVYLDGAITTLSKTTNTVFTSGQVGLYENVALGFGNFSINNAASAPSLTSTTTSLSAVPNPATVGQSVAFTATVTPASGINVPTGTVTFLDASTSIGTGTLNGSGVASFSTTSLAQATHSITASYGGDTNFSTSVSTAVSEVVNAVVVVPPPPVTPTVTITTTALPAAQAGLAYSTTLGASGGTGTYSWTATGLPSGLTMSSSGTISGTASARSNSSVAISVTASGGGSANTVLTLVVNAAPIFLSGNSNLGDIASGGSVAGGFTASGGVPPYTWSLSGIPGLGVDSSGNVRGSVSPAGNFNGSLSVTDTTGGSASVTLSLSVLGLSGSLAGGTTTSPYSGSVSGVGGAPPYSYTASGVPQGLSFSGGAFSGTATTPGSYSIGVRVSDSQGISVAGTFSLTITGPAPTTLTILTSSLPDAIVSQPYSQNLGAAGGSPGYTWAITGGQLPAGLSFSSSGTISGTPTTPGAGSFGVQVTDASGGHVVGAVSLNVDPAPLQITSGSSFPSGMTGIAYPTQILTASGGVPPYIFSTSGSVPSGLSLTGATIGGTPTAAGNFSFGLVVRDSAATPDTASLSVTGTIQPATTNLVLAGASVSFAITAGTTSAPSPATISVASSSTSQALTFGTSSSVSWLTVGGSSGTPGSVTVTPNSAALALTSTGSPYSGTVTVTCTVSPCTGSSQTIAVSLTVTSAPPQLSVGTSLLSFSSLTSTPASSTSQLAISNAGGGTLSITGVSAADSWLSVGAAPNNLLAGASSSVAVTANPSSLQAGYYTSSITVSSSAGNAVVPVTLLVSGASVMTLGPAGSQFSMSLGGAPGNSSGTFLVSVSNGTAAYSASVQGGAAWLSGGGSGSAAPSSPGNVGFSVNSSAASLAAGSYYGTIRVTGSGIVNSPLDYQVVLNVAPANTPAVPDPEPAGLVFISSGGAVPAQLVSVYVSSTSPATFSAATGGSSWLSVSPASGSASSSAPGQVTATASAVGLTPGVYQDSVSFSLGGSAVRSVNVTLIVEGSLTGSAISARAATGNRPDATQPVCAGGRLVPTETALASNFSVPAALPTGLAIALFDTCGNPVTDAQVAANFSTTDPPLTLTLVDPLHGTYSGTWTPRAASSQVAISFQASATGYATATSQISGQVTPGTAPVLAPNAISDIFHSQVGAGLAPGGIVQIYGSNLASATGTPSGIPLPASINGTQVLIGGLNAPLYYVSAGQINAQIPFELTSGSEYQVVVNTNGALATPQSIQVNAAAPAVLESTSGAVIAEHGDGSLISASSPAAPGEYVVIFLTGMGATTSTVTSGTASPSNPPASVADTATLTLNANSIPVLFAGLTPTLVGLYQINFQIPATLAAGTYTLGVSENGVTANQTTLAVQ